jgi:hypothetical protein
VRCAKYWLHWNLLSEKVAARTYRLESIRDELPAMYAALGRQPLREDIDAVPRAHVLPNVSGPVGWDDVRNASRTLTDEVLALAAYGYPRLSDSAAASHFSSRPVARSVRR